MLLVGCSRHHGLTRAQVESQIAKDLPAGSNKDKILLHLDSQRIEHSGVSEIDPDILKDPRRDTFFYDAKLDGKRDRIKKQIAAKIPDVKEDFFTKFDIYIRFYLDEHDNLVDSIVKTVGTGP